VGHRFLYSLVRDRIAVLVHDHGAPPPSAWSSFCDDEAVWAPTDLRMLVFSEHGVPNARQREQLRAVVTNRNDRVAVLTSSTLVRAAGAMMSVDCRGIRSFQPDQIEAAFEYLDLTPEESRDVHAELGRLVDALFGTGIARSAS